MKGNKNFLGILLGLGIMCSSFNCQGLDIQNICLQTKGTPSTHRSTTKITDKIERREEINAERCEFAGNLSKSDYKYIKVHRDVAYLDIDTKKILSLADMKSTFRYNNKTRNARCLSSFSRSVILNPSYSLNVSSRNANKTTDKGSGLMNVELKSSLGATLDETNLEIDCDYTGHVTSGNVELK